MYDLSIVLPTCNRASLLLKAILHIERHTHVSHEIIVVDGASTDGTGEVLQLASSIMGPRLRVIREGQREGFVRACNKGFRIARGEYLCWLNDDARPLDAALDAAIEQLEHADDSVGFVAMYHPWNHPKNVAHRLSRDGREFHLCHVRGTLYANFPMGRRETFERLGHFDERYFVCAADPDLSLKAWHAGLSVVPAVSSVIDHDETEDHRRAVDSPRGAIDNEALFAKWNLPDRSAVNDYDAARPCTLRGLRTHRKAA
jgi:GT2 family glycosyltransferase